MQIFHKIHSHNKNVFSDSWHQTRKPYIKRTDIDNFINTLQGSQTNYRNKQNKPILHCYIRQIQPKTGNAVEIACTFFFLSFFKQQEVASDIQCNTLSTGLEQTEINIRQYCTPDPTQYRCSVEQPTCHWEGVIIKAKSGTQIAQ